MTHRVVLRAVFGAIVLLAISAHAEQSRLLYWDDPTNIHIDVDHALGTKAKPYRIEGLGIWLSAEEALALLERYYDEYGDDDPASNIQIQYHGKSWDENFEPRLRQLAAKHHFYVIANSMTNSVPYSFIEKPISKRFEDIWTARQEKD